MLSSKDLLAVVVSLFFLSCTANFSTYPEAKNVMNPSDAWALIDEGALVLDVRTQGEFDEGHLEQAVLLPYELVKEQIEGIEADRKRPVIIYCAIGGRAEIARQALVELGYERVVNAGGYEDLIAGQAGQDSEQG